MSGDARVLSYRQADGLEISHTPDGWVIYRQESDRVHFLNLSAALVFELCNGRHTVAEIERILSETGVLPEAANDQLGACIASLLEEGLVTPAAGE